MNTQTLKLVEFSVNHNTNTCVVSLGKTFDFIGALRYLPKVKDGKRVIVVGLTPYTVEMVIDVPFEKRTQANYIASYNREIPEMVEKLNALTIS